MTFRKRPFDKLRKRQLTRNSTHHPPNDTHSTSPGALRQAQGAAPATPRVAEGRRAPLAAAGWRRGPGATRMSQFSRARQGQPLPELVEGCALTYRRSGLPAPLDAPTSAGGFNPQPTAGCARRSLGAIPHPVSGMICRALRLHLSATRHHSWQCSSTVGRGFP